MSGVRIKHRYELRFRFECFLFQILVLKVRKHELLSKSYHRTYVITWRKSLEKILHQRCRSKVNVFVCIKLTSCVSERDYFAHVQSDVNEARKVFKTRFPFNPGFFLQFWYVVEFWYSLTSRSTFPFVLPFSFAVFSVFEKSGMHISYDRTDDHVICLTVVECFVPSENQKQHPISFYFLLFL